MFRKRLSPTSDSRFKSFFQLRKTGRNHIPLRPRRKVVEIPGILHTHFHIPHFTQFTSSHDASATAASESSFNLGSYSLDRSAELVVRAHRNINLANRVDDR